MSAPGSCEGVNQFHCVFHRGLGPRKLNSLDIFDDPSSSAPFQDSREEIISFNIVQLGGSGEQSLNICDFRFKGRRINIDQFDQTDEVLVVD